jgi:DNA-binding transcriptional ArsR family regulator
MEERRATLVPHPARDQIVDVMRSYGQPISPTQVARITGRSLGSTSYHMRMLVSAGVVELNDEGRVRGAVEHFYALVADNREGELTDPVDQLLGLCGALTVAASDGGFPSPTVLDAAGREALERVLAQLRPEVRDIVAKATARLRA